MSIHKNTYNQFICIFVVHNRGSIIMITLYKAQYTVHANTDKNVIFLLKIVVIWISELVQIDSIRKLYAGHTRNEINHMVLKLKMITFRE